MTVRADRLTYVNLLKRHVLKRCIFGVDLNPMAVELAKVSLWLDCFTIGAPLSFLDHHLRCGNSLIGVKVEEVREALENSKDQRELLFSRFAGLLTAADLLRHVGELPDATSEQVKTSANEFRKAHDGLEPFRRILDLYTAQWFLPATEYLAPGVEKKGRRKDAPHPVLVFLRDSKSVAPLKASRAQDGEAKLTFESDKKLWRAALAVAREKRFFHWQLEYPEVFLRNREGTQRVAEFSEGAGFDAVIGNPPYRAQTVEQDRSFYRAHGHYDGHAYNYAALFCALARFVLAGREASRSGFIVPKSIIYSQGWVKTLDALWGRLICLVDVSEAFDEVLLEQAILVWTCAESTEYKAGVSTSSTILTHGCPKRLRDVFGVPIVGPRPDELALASKIIEHSRPLADFVRVDRGGPWQSKRDVRGEVPILPGRAIRSYEVDSSALERGAASILSDERAKALKRPKIVAQNIVAHIQNPQPHLRIMAAWDGEGIITLDTVNNIWLSDESVHPLELLAVLNSTVTSWYASRFVFAGAVRTIHFDETYVWRLRMPVLSGSDRADLRRAVARRLEGDVRAEVSANDVLVRGLALTKTEQHMIESTTFR